MAKKKSPERLVLDQRPVKELPINKLLKVRIIRSGFVRLGQIVSILPRDLVLRALIGEEEVVEIGVALKQIYGDFIPDQWRNKGQIRRQLRNEKRQRGKKSPDPFVDDGTWGRFKHRTSTGKHYKRRGEKGLQ